MKCVLFFCFTDRMHSSISKTKKKHESWICSRFVSTSWRKVNTKWQSIQHSCANSKKPERRSLKWKIKNVTIEQLTECCTHRNYLVCVTERILHTNIHQCNIYLKSTFNHLQGLHQKFQRLWLLVYNFFSEYRKFEYTW